jgi:methylglutaconyl-CoA hydratase
MTHNTVKLETEGELAIVTLNRPEKRNALSPELIDDLLAALDAVEASAARVAILTGAGPAFCAGMDLGTLKALADQSPEQNLAHARHTVGMFRRVWSYPKPLIAAVNGAALAGGSGLATLCDFTIASQDATFGYTEVRIGFMPALIGTFVRLQVGEKVARDLLLTGRIFDAAEARALGLVARVVPAAQVMISARELAATLLANSPGSMVATKRLLVKAVEDELDRNIALGIAASVAIRQTADYREGLAAFLERRKPQWSGR